MTVTSLPALLAAVDLGWILAATLLISLPGLRGTPDLVNAGSIFAIVAACAVLPAFAMGLYEQRHFGFAKLLPRAGLSLLLTAGALAAVMVVQADHLPRPPLEITLVALASVLGLLPIRALLPRIVDSPFLQRRVAAFGSPQDVNAVRQIQAMSSRSSFACVATLEEAPASGLLFGRRIDEVVVGEDARYSASPSLLEQRLSGTRVIGLSDFIERECRVIDVFGPEARRAALWPRRTAGSRAVKRATDVVASLVIFVFTLPVLAATALAVWLVDRGPVLYRQTRIGLGGRPFELYKFRTMRVDAEADGIPRWAEMGDPRVTPIGGFLRRSRLDELPQLLNILRGDMSLVGPRPERPALARQIAEQAPRYDCRNLVTPGVTGWAQINFPYGASVHQNIVKASYDLYYVKNGGTVLDLAILLKTVRVILLAEGSR